MKQQIALLGFTLCSLCAAAQWSDTTGWKTQIDSQFYSTLRYPPDWQVSYLNGGYTITSPKESDTDPYRENVSLFATEVPDTVMQEDIKDFAEANFIQLKTTLQDVHVMVNKSIAANGLRLYLVVYNGMAGGQYLYWKQLYCLYNNVAYIITYTGQAGKKDRYAIEGGDILNSFTPLFTKRG